MWTSWLADRPATRAVGPSGGRFLNIRFRSPRLGSTDHRVAEPNHAALLASVQAGEPNYEEIFRAYRPVMFRAALAVFGNRSRQERGKGAEDAVQTAMLEVYQKELLVPTTKNVPAVLIDVTTKRALEMVRPTKLQTTTTRDLEEAGGGSEDDTLRTTEDRVAASQVYLASMDAFSVLDENERKAFTQLYRLGRTVPEAAKELGLSEPGLRKIKGRLLSKLRKLGIGPHQ
jgi:RNA polymerase sigma factor (sigma-70 family)